MWRKHLCRLREPGLAFSVFLLSSAPGAAQVSVKVNDATFFRLGFQLQGWADWTQDPVSAGYSQNFLLRRVRLILAGQMSRNVTFFFQTDDQRLGNAGSGTGTPTKNLTAGFVVQDAFGEWKLADERLMLDAGLFYVPVSRNVLTSTSSAMSLDGGTYVQQQNALLQTNGGRDVGLGFKGYLAHDRLEYRTGVFSGVRQPSNASGAASRNSPRVALRLQYDFFDPEKGYTYVGTNRGAKRILAVGVWGDSQGDYRGYGIDLAADFPMPGGNAVTAETDWLFYDGGAQFSTPPGAAPLPRQQGLFCHAGYLLAPLALQPFLRYERLAFSDRDLRSRDRERYGGGVNWYVAGQSLKVTALYERIVARTAAAGAFSRKSDHVVVQLQFFYF